MVYIIEAPFGAVSPGIDDLSIAYSLFRLLELHFEAFSSPVLLLWFGGRGRRIRVYNVEDFAVRFSRRWVLFAELTTRFVALVPLCSINRFLFNMADDDALDLGAGLAILSHQARTLRPELTTHIRLSVASIKLSGVCSCMHHKVLLWGCRCVQASRFLIRCLSHVTILALSLASASPIARGWRLWWKCTVGKEEVAVEGVSLGNDIDYHRRVLW